jgi:hypothetical protein
MSAADNIRLIATTLDAQAVIFIVLVVIAIRGVADVVLAWRRRPAALVKGYVRALRKTRRRLM